MNERGIKNDSWNYNLDYWEAVGPPVEMENWRTQKQEQGWETTMSLVLGRLRLGATEIFKCNCLLCM